MMAALVLSAGLSVTEVKNLTMREVNALYKILEARAG
jgi:hypothetical protein